MFRNMDILELFLKNPQRELGVREAARAAGVSPTTASKKLEELRNEKVIIERDDRNLKLYKANIENPAFRDMKIFYSIRKIRESGLLKALDKFYGNPAVVLFGSVAFGFDVITSDIDIAVVSKVKGELPGLKRFEKKLGREVHISPLMGLRDLKNPHLANNVLDGIVLSGEAEWISKDAWKRI